MQHQNPKARGSVQYTVQNKQKYGFQDQNNSNFGTEWMSEKEINN